MRTRTSATMPSRTARLVAATVSVGLLLAACGADDDSATGDVTATEESASVAETDDVATTDTSTDETSTDETSTDETSTDETSTDETSDDGSATPVSAVDVGLFFDGALADDVTTEDCTLSDGAETTCYSITVAGYPASHDTGPFCPSTIEDDEGGLWWDGDELYDLDGEFVASLAEIYGDDTWLMYDEDGNVYVTETAEEFDLAARPDVDPSLQNHCVEGRLEWLENGEPITTTVLIPTEPVAAEAAAAPQGNHGVTLDGVVIANSAPVDAILGAYTIAAFDDCGAHFNPVDGYHVHGAVGCSELDGDVPEGETAMFAYALDGYPLHSPLEDGSDIELDECNGHATDELGYHYHANSAEVNQVVECLVGQTVAGTDDGPGGPPPGEG